MTLHCSQFLLVSIHVLFVQLTETNDRMSDYMQNNSAVSSSNAALLHTLQRHRDILQDYSHEFQKTRSNIVAQREREDLLGSVRRDIECVQLCEVVAIYWNCLSKILFIFFSF